jgi:NitT/TauT family transport system substrate-binding protein
MKVYLCRVVTFLGVLAGVSVLAQPTQSAEIVVSQYGVSPGSMPWAIALDQGYFKQEGVEVTNVRSASGSAPTVRDLIAGRLPYGEAGITGVLTANQAGADLKVVSCNVNTFAEVPWVTMPNSAINSLSDLKGKRIGFTTPKSATNMLAVMLVSKAGLEQDDVKMIATGGFGQALTALETGGVDIVPMVEVDYIKRAGKYKLLARSSDVLPPMSNVLGIVSAKFAAENPDVVRGIIKARRKAVQFLKQNPREAAKIIARVYQQDLPVIEATIENMLASGKSGVEFWGEGDCDLKLVNDMLNGAKTVGMIEGDFDITPITDLSFLPDDLRKK